MKIGHNPPRLEVGAELPPLTKTIQQRQIDCYSGVRPHSIHTDPEWARKKGFPAPLAQAMMSTAYVSQLMTQFAGEGFVKGGRMSVSFVKPVIVGDTLTVRGRVKSREPEGDRTRVTVEVWCENQDGVKTMVGTASGIEPGA
jgi:3-hydroxybutyryl-CoA dehydratase